MKVGRYPSRAPLAVALALVCASAFAQKAETITIWHNNTSAKNYYDAKVKEFNDTIGKQKGIVIDYKVLGDYANTLQVALAAGEGPDLYRFVGTVKEPYIRAGFMLPLDKFPGSDALVKKYSDSKLIVPEYNTFGGKVYSLPFLQIVTGMMYNKDLFKKAGIAAPPKTWDELVADASRITALGGGVEYGYGMNFKDTGSAGKWDYATIMAPSIGHMGYNFKTGRYEFSSMQRNLEYFARMVRDKSVFPGAEGLDRSSLRAQFAQGKIGIMMGANWDVAQLNVEFPAKCDWGVAPIPVVDPSKAYKQYAQISDYLVFGPAAAKHAAAAYEVFAYFHSDDVIRGCQEAGAEFCEDSSGRTVPPKVPALVGWKEFAQLGDKARSYFTKTPPDGFIQIEGDPYQNTIVKIISMGYQPADITKTLADLESRYNTALDKAKGKGVDLSPYVDPSWDTSRK
jgi:multiple sugar transport system substrate-binding protein